jgi:glycosyltransferase involved in cell wall biosynthesis
MKITIVLGAFFPVPPIMGGAVEKGWFALAQEFVRRGHDVVQMSRAVPQFPKREMIAGVRHVRVRGFNAPRSLVWLKLLDLIYSLRVRFILPAADVIVTNTFWLPLLLRNSIRGKVYVHVARFPKGQMRFYANAARLQAPSQSVANAITAEAPSLANKVSVIPYPRPDDAPRDETPSISERENIILFVGRVHREKGVHLLVDAFSRGKFRQWKLVVVGPAESRLGGGGEDYLRDLNARNSESANVVWRGPLFDETELNRQYRAAKIFVYPSLAERGETFGLAPLEAMAHGCAVLVSDIGCFHDFIADGETGFFFDHRAPDPVATLQQKLGAMIADEASLARVAEAGRGRSKDYALDRVADRFLADFESLTRN